MKFRDQIGWHATFAPRLDDSFTPEEVQRLTVLQQRLASSPVDVELGIDACRLIFARWLVEQGYLSEEITQRMPSEKTHHPYGV